MPGSKKTDILNLNIFSGNDHPKFEDVNNDNNNIEKFYAEILGNLKSNEDFLKSARKKNAAFENMLEAQDFRGENQKIYFDSFKNINESGIFDEDNLKFTNKAAILGQSFSDYNDVSFINKTGAGSNIGYSITPSVESIPKSIKFFAYKTKNETSALNIEIYKKSTNTLVMSAAVPAAEFKTYPSFIEAEFNSITADFSLEEHLIVFSKNANSGTDKGYFLPFINNSSVINSYNYINNYWILKNYGESPYVLINGLFKTSNKLAYETDFLTLNSSEASVYIEGDSLTKVSAVLEDGTTHDFIKDEAFSHPALARYIISTLTSGQKVKIAFGIEPQDANAEVSLKRYFCIY